MRTFNLVFIGLATAGLATAAMAQNTPTANPPTKPATSTASKPAGQLDNSGGGLGQNMTAREAELAFRNMDTNRDGFVDQSEFMHAGDSGQRFAGCDTNHDGKLTMAEYVQCSQRPATKQDANGHR